MQALTVHEVVAKVRLTKATIYAAIARGEFPTPATVGRRRAVWDEAEIDAYLRARFDARDEQAAA